MSTVSGPWRTGCVSVRCGGGTVPPNGGITMGFHVGMRVVNTATNSAVQAGAAGTVKYVGPFSPVVAWDAGTFGHPVAWSAEYLRPLGWSHDVHTADCMSDWAEAGRDGMTRATVMANHRLHMADVERAEDPTDGVE